MQKYDFNTLLNLTLLSLPSHQPHLSVTLDWILCLLCFYCPFPVQLGILSQKLLSSVRLYPGMRLQQIFLRVHRVTLAPASSLFVNPLQLPMRRQNSPSFTCFSQIGLLSAFLWVPLTVLFSYSVLRAGELLLSTQMLIPQRSCSRWWFVPIHLYLSIHLHILLDLLQMLPRGIWLC